MTMITVPSGPMTNPEPKSTKYADWCQRRTEARLAVSQRPKAAKQPVVRPLIALILIVSLFVMVLAPGVDMGAMSLALIVLLIATAIGKVLR